MQLTSVSNVLIKGIITHWWIHTGRPEMNKTCIEISTNAGAAARIDHSYYSTSCLGLMMNNIWVSVLSKVS